MKKTRQLSRSSITQPKKKEYGQVHQEDISKDKTDDQLLQPAQSRQRLGADVNQSSRLGLSSLNKPREFKKAQSVSKSTQDPRFKVEQLSKVVDREQEKAMEGIDSPVNQAPFKINLSYLSPLKDDEPSPWPSNVTPLNTEMQTEVEQVDVSAAYRTEDHAQNQNSESLKNPQDSAFKLPPKSTTAQFSSQQRTSKTPQKLFRPRKPAYQESIVLKYPETKKRRESMEQSNCETASTQHKVGPSVSTPSSKQQKNQSTARKVTLASKVSQPVLNRKHQPTQGKNAQALRPWQTKLQQPGQERRDSRLNQLSKSNDNADIIAVVRECQVILKEQELNDKVEEIKGSNKTTQSRERLLSTSPKEVMLTEAVYESQRHEYAIKRTTETSKKDDTIPEECLDTNSKMINVSCLSTSQAHAEEARPIQTVNIKAVVCDTSPIATLSDLNIQEETVMRALSPGTSCEGMNTSVIEHSTLLDKTNYASKQDIRVSTTLSVARDASQTNIQSSTIEQQQKQQQPVASYLRPTKSFVAKAVQGEQKKSPIRGHKQVQSQFSSNLKQRPISSKLQNLVERAEDETESITQKLQGSRPVTTTSSGGKTFVFPTHHPNNNKLSRNKTPSRIGGHFKSHSMVQKSFDMVSKTPFPQKSVKKGTDPSRQSHATITNLDRKDTQKHTRVQSSFSWFGQSKPRTDVKSRLPNNQSHAEVNKKKTDLSQDSKQQRARDVVKIESHLRRHGIQTDKSSAIVEQQPRERTDKSNLRRGRKERVHNLLKSVDNLKQEAYRDVATSQNESIGARLAQLQSVDTSEDISMSKEALQVTLLRDENGKFVNGNDTFDMTSVLRDIDSQKQKGPEQRSSSHSASKTSLQKKPRVYVPPIDLSKATTPERVSPKNIKHQADKLSNAKHHFRVQSMMNQNNLKLQQDSESYGDSSKQDCATSSASPSNLKLKRESSSIELDNRQYLDYMKQVNKKNEQLKSRMAQAMTKQQLQQYGIAANAQDTSKVRQSRERTKPLVQPQRMRF